MSEKKLTRKQAAFVKELIDNPKISATEAAARTYNTTSRHSAEVVAHENLRKPEIMQHLRDHAKDAESVLTEVMEYSKSKGAESPSYAAVAVAAAKDVLDRVHGKAVQRVESSSTAITFKIDLSGTADDGVITEGEVVG